MVQSVSTGVDYSLRRNSLLRDFRAGLRDTNEVCDASSYLLSASYFHGETTPRRCPICRRENLRLVHYIFGDELRSSSGQARSRAELVALSRSHRHFDVYVVEVCRGCGWNHVIQSYAMGQDNSTPKAATPHENRGISRPGRTGIKTQ